MTGKVVPLRTLPAHRPRSVRDEILEANYTAGRFATAIRLYAIGANIDPEVIAEAEAFVTFGTPVRRYQGGAPVQENGGGDAS